ncbi:MAG: hypothetical protein AAF298_20270 [Cyanobacteria bacterium P01_A01_bin.40]
MSKSQLYKHQFIFNTLLDNLLLQCTVKSNFTGSNFVAVHTCIDALSIILTIIPDIRLRQSLRQLQEQLPHPEANRAIFESWWQIKQLVWAEELNAIIFLYRNIQSCYYDNLSNSEILKCYYKVNKILIDYLSHNHELTITLRRKLEAVLLSSEAELSQSSANQIRDTQL